MSDDLFYLLVLPALILAWGFLVLCVIPWMVKGRWPWQEWPEDRSLRRKD